MKIPHLALALALSIKGICAPSVPKDEFFKVETLVEGLVDAMEITVLPTGDVFIAERTGALKWYSPKTGETKEIKKFEVSVKTKKGTSRETGLLGITADPNFMKNGWFYVYYSPKSPEVHRLSRFTFSQGKVKDEKRMLEIPQSRKEGVCHEGGSLAFDSKGNLFLSTGDNAAPFPAKGYPPLDERKGHEHENSQRSASNSNDLRGKVLRIRPTANGGYSIPSGNLFAKGTAKTRPEIYAMGCRNPWRIGVDQRTDYLYWGEVGPDARKNTSRGPRGYCEINQAKEPGNFGWPYFVADNQAYARYDFESKKTGDKFIATAPENESRLNTGLKTLPAAQEPLWFQPRSCYCAGPVYYYDDFSNSAAKLPRGLDGCLITYDWNNGRMQLTKLDKEGNMEWKEDWLHSKKFIHPSDVELGPDGSMYVLEYGSKWYNGKNGKLKRVTFTKAGDQVVKNDGLDPRLEGLKKDHPGTQLLAKSTCLSCHQTQEKSVGPSYSDVADLYRDKENAADLLTQKVMKGGVGAWGKVPMPPNPQYNEEQVSQMVDAILSLKPGGHKK
ncbi:PQQ-dependent sugar dehydrogenase [Verrucomicrobiaceae bacterium 5K15]|uniref:PQQ-dependent sugar dehydrogenase n=1 Tax=Oceaniferula flava TaxID=2800421 RepID=A0AAE2SCI5_9BACT|nr:PQQ-dependent sugar dehydrogenase [Oceaniferula flavus]MBK1855691.1 PQQ-dependent sugar dehydrogenase [Oceaniferula flavus]MBM1136997.1 PQQ-dependent sugar dehydrogenase [Oceaniferula flavus]